MSVNSVTGLARLQINNSLSSNNSRSRYASNGDTSNKMLKQSFPRNELANFNSIGSSAHPTKKLYLQQKEYEMVANEGNSQIYKNGFRSSQKQSINGRKGHQVMQSQGFSKAKGSAIDKSFDNEKLYQSYLNISTPLNNGVANSRQLHQALHPFGYANGSVTSTKKRNHSYGSSAAQQMPLSGLINADKKTVKPLMKVPNSKGQRYGLSNHKRNFTNVDDRQNKQISQSLVISRQKENQRQLNESELEQRQCQPLQRQSQQRSKTSSGQYNTID